MADDLLSGQISFTGLGSGTDFGTMIEKLIEIEGNHKKQLERWRVGWEAKVETLQTVNTAMLDLRTSLQGMDSMNEFLTKSVESSNSSVASVTAKADAEEATHRLQVNQLATNAIVVANTGFAAKDSEVVTTGSETFAYTYKGEEYAVTAAAGATLQDLANLINSDPENGGVRASLISDGSQFYLQMRGLDMGSNASLSFNAAASTMTNAAFDDAGDFSTTQENQNAQFKVNGWPVGSNAWVQADSNTIDDAIQGLTINLKSDGGAPPTEVQIAVTTDYESVKNNVRTFVEKVNEVRSLIQDITKVDDTTEEGSILTGNYAVQLVDSRLKQITANLGRGFNYYEPGPPPSGDIYSSLSQIGILTVAEEGDPEKGLLRIDEEALDDALSNDPNAVAQLFAAQNIGGQLVDSGNFSFHSQVTGLTKGGSYDVEYTVSGGQITSAFIDGKAATIDNTEGFITSTQGDSIGLVVKINDFPNDGSGSGQVTVKQGKAGEMVDLLGDLTNGESGPLNILEENYEDIIDNIDKKIEFEESRLAKRSQMLREKYARLEALLGEYDGISQSIAGQINQLPTS